MLKATILVVDDEPGVVNLLQCFLEQQSYRVVTAATAAEAMLKLRQEHPQVVLLDIKLPDGNGIDVLQQIKREAPGTGVVMVTGINDDLVGSQTMQIGAFDYITKPISLEYLEKVLTWQLRLLP